MPSDGSCHNWVQNDAKKHFTQLASPLPSLSWAHIWICQDMTKNAFSRLRPELGPKALKFQWQMQQKLPPNSSGRNRVRNHCRIKHITQHAFRWLLPQLGPESCKKKRSHTVSIFSSLPLVGTYIDMCACMLSNCAHIHLQLGGELVFCSDLRLPPDLEGHMSSNICNVKPCWRPRAHWRQ